MTWQNDLAFPKKKRARIKDRRTADGYGSKLEKAVGQILELRVKAGEIRNLRRQFTVVLQDGPPNERIAVKIDFAFEVVETGLDRAAEAKGLRTERWNLILKLWRRLRPMDLEIWEGSAGDPRLTEVIE